MHYFVENNFSKQLDMTICALNVAHKELHTCNLEFVQGSTIRFVYCLPPGRLS